MEEAPETPAPPPEIPKGKLWTALLLPPAIMCFGSLIARDAASRSLSYGEEFLVMLPVGLVTILATAVLFVQVWRIRYRGRSLVLTTLGYILGQIVLCLAVWFGCCLIPFR
jgi:cell division protein FtsW (lipid II flippase)